jgi:hypothetical protein
MPLIARRKVLLAKIEVTYGTDPTPDGTNNAILARNINLTPLEQIVAPRQIVQSYLGNSDELIAASYVRLDFEVEMAGGGAAGTAPKYGPLLRACAMSETTSAGVDVQYKPISTTHESITLYFYVDGRLHKLLGARGTVGLRMGRLGDPVFAFSFTGLYAAVTDAANASPTLTGFQTPLPVNNTNTTSFALHSYSGVLDNLSIDLNNQVVYRHLVGAETVIIPDRGPRGSVMMESVLVATKDWWTIARAGTLSTLSILQGTTAGNKVQIDAPKVQITQPRESEQDGVQMITLGLLLKPSSGNDELVIKVF